MKNIPMPQKKSYVYKINDKNRANFKTCKMEHSYFNDINFKSILLTQKVYEFFYFKSI